MSRIRRRLYAGALCCAVGLGISAPATASSGSAAGTLRLAGNWAFDEGSGTVAHDSVAGHNATVDPDKPDFGWTLDTLATPDRWVGHFIGDDGLMLIQPSSALSPGSRDVQINVDVKTTDDKSNIFQAGTTKPGHDFIKIEMASSTSPAIKTGVPRCRFTGSAGGVTMKGKKAINDGQWHTIVCTKTAHSVSMTLDGVVVATRNLALGTIDVSRDRWSIGGKYTPNRVVDPHDMFTGYLRNAQLRIGQ